VAQVRICVHYCSNYLFYLAFLKYLNWGGGNCDRLLDNRFFPGSVVSRLHNDDAYVKITSRPIQCSQKPKHSGTNVNLLLSTINKKLKVKDTTNNGNMNKCS
jgi:hypothetical protein